MGRVSIDESKVLSLFPSLDKDSSAMLFYIMREKKRVGETLIVKFMEDCSFLELWGKFSIKDFTSFFEKKSDVLRELCYGKEKKRVFSEIDFRLSKIKWELTEDFYKEAIL